VRLFETQDPYYRANDIAYRWVALDDWAYQRVFSLPGLLLQNKALRLFVEGVDTISSISINGQLLGQTDNMFRRYVYDITRALMFFRRSRDDGAAVDGFAE
jgi:beta-mannosidase